MIVVVTTALAMIKKKSNNFSNTTDKGVEFVNLIGQKVLSVLVF